LIDTLCGALGTQTIARIREWQGDYTFAFIGMAVLATLSASMVLSLTRVTARSDSPAQSYRCAFLSLRNPS
jgi:hypothetical protein